MGKICSTDEVMLKCIHNCGREAKKKSYVGRSRHIWADSIKTDLRERRCQGVDCMQLAHDKVQWQEFMNTVMNHRILQKWEII
jgi:hypothetical protein